MGGLLVCGDSRLAEIISVYFVVQPVVSHFCKYLDNQEPFQDGPRSIRMMVPSGWNKFEGEVGAYDLKWQDLVDPNENIKISSTPVKSTTTSVEPLGDVKTVGESLASKRNAKLLSAEERLTDGILFYKFDFALDDGTHQLLQLCVSKGKLWSIDASAKEKRWPKRSELYENVLVSTALCPSVVTTAAVVLTVVCHERWSQGSFMPKLS
jgi:photosystem II oxygen-evolving enhancer protein 2